MGRGGGLVMGGEAGEGGAGGGGGGETEVGKQHTVE